MDLCWLVVLTYLLHTKQVMRPFAVSKLCCDATNLPVSFFRLFLEVELACRGVAASMLIRTNLLATIQALASK